MSVSDHYTQRVPQDPSLSDSNTRKIEPISVADLSELTSSYPEKHSFYERLITVSERNNSLLHQFENDTSLETPDSERLTIQQRNRAVAENLKIYQYFFEHENPYGHNVSEDSDELYTAASSSIYELFQLDNFYETKPLIEEFSEADYEDQTSLYQEIVQKARPNTELISELYQSSDFKGKKYLTFYLLTDIWRKESQINYLNDLYTTDIPNFSLDAYQDLLVLGFEDLVKSGDPSALEQNMLVLLSIGGVGVANKVLVSPEFSKEERKSFAISYINTFGFGTFSRFVEQTTNLPEDLIQVFAEINNVDRAQMRLVKDVEEFYLSSKDRFEHNYEDKALEEDLSRVSEGLKRLGIDITQARVLDLGAGWGRVSLGLLNKGAKSVTSVEYSSDFVADMQNKAQESGLLERWRPIRGDWKELEALDVEEHDIGVCLGRSLPHASSTDDLIRVMSQMTAWGMPNVWVFDFPNSEEGFFSEKSKAYVEHLKKLGIDPRAMNLVYDGILDSDRKHRMFASNKQIESILKLFGFRIVKKEDVKQKTDYSDNVVNSYYVVERIPNYDVFDLSPQEIETIFEELELLKPGADLNQLLPAPWNLSLAQIIMYNQDSNRNGSYLYNQSENLVEGAPTIRTFYGPNGYLSFEQSFEL